MDFHQTFLNSAKEDMPIIIDKMLIFENQKTKVDIILDWYWLLVDGIYISKVIISYIIGPNIDKISYQCITTKNDYPSIFFYIISKSSFLNCKY